jgi:hypothetical protein
MTQRYTGISPAPHAYGQALAALRERDIRVIGFDSGDGSARSDLATVATDTGAVGTDGRPLVFDVGRRGERLGTEVIGAIELFASAIVFDVDALLVDPDPRDEIDPRDFVEAVIPLSASPPDGIESIDVEAGVFRGVISGTDLLFQLRLRNDAIVAGPTARRFRLEIVFRGDERTRLDRRIIEIVIPGADGTGCDIPL